MDFKITLYQLVEKYVKGEICIYELNKENSIFQRKKIKISMGIINKEILTIKQWLINDVELPFNDYIVFYQNGILKKKEDFYYYNVEEKLEENEKEYFREEALNIKINLKKIENLRVIGRDIFEIEEKNKINILNLKYGLNSYFPKPVKKINYIFSYNSIEKSWDTLNYMVVYQDNENICYNFLENRQIIKLPKIEYDEVVDISENSETLIIKNDDKVELFYQGEKKLIFDRFIQRIKNFYFLETKNKIKIYNEKGEQLEKGFKVISTFPIKLNQRIIVLKNTKTHRVELLIFDEEFKNYFLFKEKFYNLENKVFIQEKEEGVIVFNLENKKIELKNVNSKAIKLVKVDTLKESNLKLDFLEVPYKIERGKFYYTDSEKYKKEYTKLYLINLNEIGLKELYLESDENLKYDIETEREKKANYRNEKIEKIFLERSDRVLSGIYYLLFVIYKIESMENNKLKKSYITYRCKYLYEYTEKKIIDCTNYGEDNEYYNLISNREDLDNLENDIPQEIKEYLQKIIK